MKILNLTVEGIVKMHDRIYVNQEMSKIKAEVFVIVSDANRGCKKRLISPPGNDFWTTAFVALEGHLELHGGNPTENSRSRSGTSRMLLVWWTDHEGRRHVRLRGGRDKSKTCHKSWDGMFLGEAFNDYFLWIYPTAFFKDGKGKTVVRCIRCGRQGSVKHLQPTELDCGICRDLNEYCESGFIPAVGKHNAKARPS